MSLPALKDAASDHALRGLPLAVYIHLHEGVLDVRDFRPVKQLALVFALGCAQSSASRALGILVRRGYLELGPGSRADAMSYRLTYSRRPDPQSVLNHPEAGAHR